MKIGVIGLGFVGGAVQSWFESRKQPLKLYDKFKNVGSVDEVNEADVVFVCVPTPYHADGRGYDDSAVRDSLQNLQGEKTVVLKSTILPGSTEKFQKEFPRHKVFFNPEFLVARTAKEDFIKPDRQIVGYTERNKSLAEGVLEILPDAPYKKVLPATEAEVIKYFGNVFLSTRVIYANQMYDLCQALGVDYNEVKEAAGADPRIGTSHFDVHHDGYRGYGGACLPKDTAALLSLAKSLEVDFRLIEALEEINKDLREGQ